MPCDDCQYLDCIDDDEMIYICHKKNKKYCYDDLPDFCKEKVSYNED